MPSATIATDVIVGFPGETDEPFQQTHALLAEVGMRQVHLAMYSPRPGTLSARWPDDVPHIEKQRRHRELETQQEQVCTRMNERRWGPTVEVLVEGRPKGGGRAYQGQHARPLDDGRNVLGKLIDVQITETSPGSCWVNPLAVPR
jgi:tRNA-2-methylthio-N6-dimethylallyladenosine synthase